MLPTQRCLRGPTCVASRLNPNNNMLFAIFNMLKGRFSKEAINEAKSNEKAMSRQEALQQMRNIASRRITKKD
jgi:ABC-type uncharacterized transport system YnjBCD ATPase subunit